MAWASPIVALVGLERSRVNVSVPSVIVSPRIGTEIVPQRQLFDIVTVPLFAV